MKNYFTAQWITKGRKKCKKKNPTVTMCTMRNVTDLKIFIQFNLTVHIGVDFA